MNVTAKDQLFDKVSDIEKRLWFLLTGFSIVAGVYFRFLGFSTWPLATDEFYIYRSMAFVLETGLPEFPCGGYYTRGLLYQYLTVPLLALGMSAEAAVRLLTILGNLAMLPAAFLLARQIGGLRLACAAVTILALSTWEIEMARFGRMYAPFQAVFVWYAYHLYMLVTTDDRRRWRWLVGLSIMAPLVWEGGVTILAANFLPILMRPSFWQLRHLVFSVLILVSSIVFLETKFRALGGASAAPPLVAESSTGDSTAPLQPAAGSGDSISQPSAMVDATPVTGAIGDTGTASSSPASSIVEPLGIEGFMGADLVASPVPGLLFAALFLILIIGFARLVPRYRSDVQALATLALAAVSVLLNQIFLAVLVLVGASLIDWFRIRDLLLARYRSVVLPLLGISGIWVWLALSAGLGADSGAGLKALIKSLLPLMSFPDLINSFLYLWLVSLPLMTIVLLLGTGLTLARCLFNPAAQNAGLRMLAAFLLLCLTIIGIASLQYLETRYSFHLYPLLLLLGLVGFVRAPVVGAKVGKALAKWAPPIVVAVFALSSDFSLGHMLRIDTYEANFRVGYSGIRARHYYSRFDFESPAVFVNQHAAASDIVITAAVPAAQYLRPGGFVFMHREDVRYELQACDFGNMERWTGLPLLDTVEDIEDVAESRPDARVWLLVDHYALKGVLSSDYLTKDAGFEQVFIADDEKIRVFRR